MPTYSTSNIHLDVLMGRDESLNCADFMMPSTSLNFAYLSRITNPTLIAGSELQQPLSIHAEMERKRRM